MFQNKRRNEGILYEPPNTRNKINDDASSEPRVLRDVREELAGTETFLTDTQGLRLAYENPDRIYRNGSILYIAGTKDPIDFYDDLKLPFYQTRNTKRYKDVDKFIKDGTIEVDGKKLTGITDIISHSLGSAVGQQINNDSGNIFRSRSYGSPFVSNQRPEDTGTNLRIRKSGDPVSMFDSGSLTLNRGTLDASAEASRGFCDPLQNHSYQDIGNVHNKAGNLPITQEEFLQQFDIKF